MTNGKRCAIVTGGARGIGRGISLALAKDGYAVCAAGTKSASDERVAAYTDELTALSPESFYCQCDISSAGDRLRLMDEAWGRFGTVEVLVNNAGVAPLERNDILEMTEESYDRVMGINCRSVFFLTQEMARRMAAVPAQENVMRAIVFITSISAEVSSVSRGEYCMSKAALSMAVKLYADRMAEYGVNVYEVRPGIIATDMTAVVRAKYDALIENGLLPIRHIGQPEEVASMVLALANGAMRYSTGTTFDADGGFMLRRL